MLAKPNNAKKSASTIGKSLIAKKGEYPLPARDQATEMTARGWKSRIVPRMAAI